MGLTGQISGRRLYQLLGVSLLELLWQQVTERRVQSACVVNLVGELWNARDDLRKRTIFAEINVLALGCYTNFDSRESIF
jgi:hypothetical protein